MIVVDASVFNKLFLGETDSDKALDLFRFAITNDVERVAPDILLYEAFATALHFGIEFSQVFRLLQIQRAAGFKLVEPSLAVLEIAEDIAAFGNKKSGFPALFDSIYHALAIEMKGSFITADKRHYAKAKSFGSILLLKDWEDFLQA